MVSRLYSVAEIAEIMDITKAAVRQRIAVRGVVRAGNLGTEYNPIAGYSPGQLEQIKRPVSWLDKENEQ